MRLTIFWRVFLAQVSLIVLILAVSLYALFQLNRLTDLSTGILATDYAGIEAEKRLLAVFLAEMRSVEKYLVLRDPAFADHFAQGESDFNDILEAIATLLSTPQERELVEQIRDLHARYAMSLIPDLANQEAWQHEKTRLSNAITEGVNSLIHSREDAITRKTATARDQAALAGGVVWWLAVGGIGIAVLLSYLSARGVSRPLGKLAKELRYVGEGEFRRSFEIRSPKEVGELAQAFNWMSQRLAELDAMKADFVAHVSHELRTPLTAVQEGTALLLEEIPGPLTSSQREILDVVRNHGERLFQSLSSVLDLSKMEAGMMEYVMMPSDIMALIHRSVETVHLIAQKKRVRLETECVTPLPLLSLDERRIQQVLDNLLVNGVKFTPEEGRVKVRVTLQNDPESEKKWVEVRITDTGRGIPIGEEAQIFDKFYQSQHRQEESVRGTGLGLTIARYIVEAHRGSIWAESRVEGGATFIFTLPVTPEGKNIEEIKEIAFVPHKRIEHAA